MYVCKNNRTLPRTLFLGVTGTTLIGERLGISLVGASSPLVEEV